MKVLFFFPKTGYYNRALSNPLGLLAIASYLKNLGHTVRITDCNIQRVNVKKELADFQPDAVGISVMSSRGIKDAVHISKIAKEQGQTVIWGGQMPSIQPELALSCQYVDYICIGEGELIWRDILEALGDGKSLRGIPGLALRGPDGGIEMTPCRPFADLKDFGMLDFSLLEMEKYTQDYLGCKKMVYLYSAKGCPGNCAFCSNTTFHKSTFRKRPAEYVIREIEYLVEHYGVDSVYFSDELWCMNREDLQDFCRQIKESGVRIHFGIQLRIGMFREEDYRLLYECGCRWVIFGIETGNTEMQKRIHKHLSFEKVCDTFEMTNRIGLISIGSMIIGYPDETEDQLRDSVRLMNTAKADLWPVYYFTPLPGTELFNEVVRRGLYSPPKTLKELEREVETEKIGVNLSKIPDRDLKVVRCWYNWQALAGKNDFISDKKFEFAADTIRSGLHSISMRGTFSFLINGFAAFREIVYTFWYSHAYPKIIKKYSLNFKP